MLRLSTTAQVPVSTWKAPGLRLPPSSSLTQLHVWKELCAGSACSLRALSSSPAGSTHVRTRLTTSLCSAPTLSKGLIAKEVFSQLLGLQMALTPRTEVNTSSHSLVPTNTYPAQPAFRKCYSFQRGGSEARRVHRPTQGLRIPSGKDGTKLWKRSSK